MGQAKQKHTVTLKKQRTWVKQNKHTVTQKTKNMGQAKQTRLQKTKNMGQAKEKHGYT